MRKTQVDTDQPENTDKHCHQPHASQIMDNIRLPWCSVWKTLKTSEHLPTSWCLALVNRMILTDQGRSSLKPGYFKTRKAYYEGQYIWPCRSHTVTHLKRSHTSNLVIFHINGSVSQKIQSFTGNWLSSMQPLSARSLKWSWTRRHFEAGQKDSVVRLLTPRVVAERSLSLEDKVPRL